MAPFWTSSSVPSGLPVAGSSGVPALSGSPPASGASSRPLASGLSKASSGTPVSGPSGTSATSGACPGTGAPAASSGCSSLLSLLVLSMCSVNSSQLICPLFTRAVIRFTSSSSPVRMALLISPWVVAAASGVIAMRLGQLSGPASGYEKYSLKAISQVRLYSLLSSRTVPIHAEKVFLQGRHLTCRAPGPGSGVRSPRRCRSGGSASSGATAPPPATSPDRFLPGPGRGVYRRRFGDRPGVRPCRGLAHSSVLLRPGPSAAVAATPLGVQDVVVQGTAAAGASRCAFHFLFPLLGRFPGSRSALLRSSLPARGHRGPGSSWLRPGWPLSRSSGDFPSPSRGRRWPRPGAGPPSCPVAGRPGCRRPGSPSVSCP